MRGTGIALAIGAALFGCAVMAQEGALDPAATGAAGNTPVAGYLADPAALRRGKLLFIGSCGAYCHSTKNVERDAPSLFDCEWRYGGSEQQIHDSIANGVQNTRMPAWKGVLPEGDDDIWKLVAYLKSTSTCGAPST